MIGFLLRREQKPRTHGRGISKQKLNKMKHPLYNDPEYVAAIEEIAKCDNLIGDLRNRIFRANKIIDKKEKEYQEKCLTIYETTPN